MRLTIVGSGDAFGSGGRRHTCFHAETAAGRWLIDCGATAVPGLSAGGIGSDDVDGIVLSHLHGDHFGGLPFLMLDAQFFSKRTRPLTIAGPAGIADRLARAMETAFPGSSRTTPGFSLTVTPLEPGRTVSIGSLAVTPYPVNHGNDGGPFFAYRIAAEGRVVAYTGDTEWTETLVEAGRDADLMIAEAYFRDKPVKLHLDLATLEAHLDRIRPKRLVLTHMSEDMLARRREVPYLAADDGLVVAL